MSLVFYRIEINTKKVVTIVTNAFKISSKFTYVYEHEEAASYMDILFIEQSTVVEFL